MKNFTASIVAVLSLNTFAFAGGDIAPVEPEVMLPEVVESTPGSFYVGLAYSYIKADSDISGEYFDGEQTYTGSAESDWNAIMLQAGYQFNQYLGIEGRYWSNLGTGDFSITEVSTEDEYPGFSVSGDADDITAWGIYLKPTLPLNENFNLYALLGYGNVDIGSWDDSSFQWGAGISYSILKNLSLFVDYVNLYDDSSTESYDHNYYDAFVTETFDDTLYTINVGITYSF